MHFPVIYSSALAAAENGHLKIVTFLDNHKDSIFTGTDYEQFLTAAALHGHLDAIKHFVNRGYRYTAIMAEDALSFVLREKTKHEMMNWLYSSTALINRSGKRDFSSRLLLSAALGARLDILKWIHANFEIEVSDLDFDSFGDCLEGSYAKLAESLLRNAIRSGDVNTVNWIRTTTIGDYRFPDNYDYSYAKYLATIYGATDILESFGGLSRRDLHRAEKEDWFSKAAANNSLASIEYLHKRIKRLKWDVAMRVAVKYDRLQAVK